MWNVAISIYDIYDGAFSPFSDYLKFRRIF